MVRTSSLENYSKILKILFPNDENIHLLAQGSFTTIFL